MYSRHNALAPAQDAGPELSDHDLSLHFAAHVCAVFRAEDQGVPVTAPDTVTTYMRRFHARTLKALDGSNPRRSLENGAALFRSLKGWRGDFPPLAEACAMALEALAKERNRPVGRPRGTTQIVERRYVNRAFNELTELALSRGRLDWARELFKHGSVNKPPRGRLLVAARTVRLAEADGVYLSSQEVREQIREYARKTALPSLNVLSRKRKERQSPHKKKIPAAGM